MGIDQVVPAANALAKSPRTIKDLLQSKEFELAVASALPRHLKIERFMRVALNATMRQPELLECSKESFFLRLLELSALGLEPDGRRAHLIPFWNNQMCGDCNHPTDQHKGTTCQVRNCTCAGKRSRREVQLIVDYKGIAELVRRSGDVSYMHADAVYEKDEWDFKYGSGAFLTHKPNLEVEDRGRIRAFYSFVKLRDGNEDFIVMPKAEVDKVRSRSKAKDSGPWQSDYGEMGKKTAFRRHSKWLPLSAESKEAIEADDESDAIDATGALALAGETVTENGSDRESRLERQMAEQGAADPVSANSAEAQKLEQRPLREETGHQPASDGMWPDRPRMIADFRKVIDDLGEEEAIRMMANDGIAGDDDLGIQDSVTAAVYKKLVAAAQEKKTEKVPENVGKAAEKFTFGRRNR